MAGFIRFWKHVRQKKYPFKYLFVLKRWPRHENPPPCEKPGQRAERRATPVFCCCFVCLFDCLEMVTWAPWRENPPPCEEPGQRAERSAPPPFLPRNIWPKASTATAVLKLTGNQQDLWLKVFCQESFCKKVFCQESCCKKVFCQEISGQRLPQPPQSLNWLATNKICGWKLNLWLLQNAS